MLIDMILNTIRAEGDYSNNPEDNGGETYRGISRHWNPNWDGWSVIDQTEDKNNLKNNQELNDLVYLFYYDNYYKQFSMITNVQIKEELYDTSVNIGIKRTKKMLQEALNLLNRNEKDFDDLVVDGLIGSKSINAFNKVSKVNLLKTLRGLQFVHYYTIVTDKKSQEIFFNGWLKRV